MENPIFVLLFLAKSYLKEGILFRESDILEGTAALWLKLVSIPAKVRLESARLETT